MYRKENFRQQCNVHVTAELWVLCMEFSSCQHISVKNLEGVLVFWGNLCKSTIRAMESESEGILGRVGVGGGVGVGVGKKSTDSDSDLSLKS
jgi:hypothetical protein